MVVLTPLEGGQQKKRPGNKQARSLFNEANDLQRVMLTVRIDTYFSEMHFSTLVQ
jgi:hypothetical protein